MVVVYFLQNIICFFFFFFLWVHGCQSYSKFSIWIHVVKFSKFQSIDTQALSPNPCELQLPLLQYSRSWLISRHCWWSLFKLKVLRLLETELKEYVLWFLEFIICYCLIVLVLFFPSCLSFFPFLVFLKYFYFDLFLHIFLISASFFLPFFCYFFLFYILFLFLTSFLSHLFFSLFFLLIQSFFFFNFFLVFLSLFFVSLFLFLSHFFRFFFHSFLTPH